MLAPDWRRNAQFLVLGAWLRRTATGVFGSMQTSASRIAASPAAGDNRDNIGTSELQLGHYDVAIATFRKSLTENPGFTLS